MQVLLLSTPLAFESGLRALLTYLEEQLAYLSVFLAGVVVPALSIVIVIGILYPFLTRRARLHVAVLPKVSVEPTITSENLDLAYRISQLKEQRDIGNPNEVVVEAYRMLREELIRSLSLNVPSRLTELEFIRYLLTQHKMLVYKEAELLQVYEIYERARFSGRKISEEELENLLSSITEFYTEVRQVRS